MSLESKSLLAKLMAQENLVVEQRPVSTAYFDFINRVLVVPVLNNDIPPHTYDLFMGHEVGHALWTPKEVNDICDINNIPFGLVNIIEDSRIERKIKNKYPGLKNSFIKGYKDLFSRNFFGTSGVNINELKFVDRINLHCKGGASLNVKFNESEMEIVKSVESTDSFDDVISVCKKIKEFLKSEINESFKSNTNSIKNDDLETSDVEPNNPTTDDFHYTDTKENSQDVVSSNDDNSTIVENESENDSEESKSNNEKVTSNNKNSSNNSDVAELDDLLFSNTNENYKNNEYKLFSENNFHYNYINIPKIDIEKCVIGYKTVYNMVKEQITPTVYDHFYSFGYEKLQEIKNEIKNGTSYLAKEFEMRKNAEQMKKTSTAKTGDLNLNKIYSHQFNEDIFKRITIVPGAKSHGLVIYLDFSGSMVNHLDSTFKQLFNIVMFCKKVNIPYEVYTFTNNTVHPYTTAQNDIKKGDMNFGDIRLLNILSSRMNAKEFNDACSILVSLSLSNTAYELQYVRYELSLFNMGGTPLNEALLTAMEIVPEFKKKYNLQIVNTIFLTDGEGDAIYGYYDENLNVKRLVNYDYNLSKAIKTIIRDPVTKMEQIITQREKTTDAFVKLFKYRTKCNIVGFYILSPSDFKRYLNNKNMNVEDSQKIRSQFSKDYCAVIDDDAFDEYYLLRSDRKDYSSENDFQYEFDESFSSKRVANLFKKIQGKKNNKRTVLNRFIKMIA